MVNFFKDSHFFHKESANLSDIESELNKALEKGIVEKKTIPMPWDHWAAETAQRSGVRSVFNRIKLVPLKTIHKTADMAKLKEYEKELQDLLKTIEKVQEKSSSFPIQKKTAALLNEKIRLIEKNHSKVLLELRYLQALEARQKNQASLTDLLIIYTHRSNTEGKKFPVEEKSKIRAELDAKETAFRKNYYDTMKKSFNDKHRTLRGWDKKSEHWKHKTNETEKYIEWLNTLTLMLKNDYNIEERDFPNVDYHMAVFARQANEASLEDLFVIIEYRSKYEGKQFNNSQEKKQLLDEAKDKVKIIEEDYKKIENNILSKIEEIETPEKLLLLEKKWETMKLEFNKNRGDLNFWYLGRGRPEIRELILSTPFLIELKEDSKAGKVLGTPSVTFEAKFSEIDAKLKQKKLEFKKADEAGLKAKKLQPQQKQIERRFSEIVHQSPPRPTLENLGTGKTPGVLMDTKSEKFLKLTLPESAGAVRYYNIAELSKRLNLPIDDIKYAQARGDQALLDLLNQHIEIAAAAHGQEVIRQAYETLGKELASTPEAGKAKTPQDPTQMINEIIFAFSTNTEIPLASGHVLYLHKEKDNSLPSGKVSTEKVHEPEKLKKFKNFFADPKKQLKEIKKDFRVLFNAVSLHPEVKAIQDRFSKVIKSLPRKPTLANLADTVYTAGPSILSKEYITVETPTSEKYRYKIETLEKELNLNRDAILAAQKQGKQALFDLVNKRIEKITVERTQQILKQVYQELGQELAPTESSEQQKTKIVNDFIFTGDETEIGIPLDHDHILYLRRESEEQLPSAMVFTREQIKKDNLFEIEIVKNLSTGQDFVIKMSKLDKAQETLKKDFEILTTLYGDTDEKIEGITEKPEMLLDFPVSYYDEYIGYPVPHYDGTLSELQTHLTPKQATESARQLLHGLVAMKEKGIAHGNIDAENCQCIITDKGIQCDFTTFKNAVDLNKGTLKRPSGGNASEKDKKAYNDEMTRLNKLKETGQVPPEDIEAMKQFIYKLDVIAMGDLIKIMFAFVGGVSTAQKKAIAELTAAMQKHPAKDRLTAEQALAQFESMFPAS